MYGRMLIGLFAAFRRYHLKNSKGGHDPKLTLLRAMSGGDLQSIAHRPVIPSTMIRHGTSFELPNLVQVHMVARPKTVSGQPN